MGLYNDRVLPRILSASCASKTLDPLRRRVCTGLAGEVVEIGFGSGLNIPFYPTGVTGVTGVAKLTAIAAPTPRRPHEAPRRPC